VSKRIFVLGAGFTKAFAPEMPLMQDNYSVVSSKEQGGAEHSQGMGNAVQQGMFLLRVARAPRIGEKRVRQD
jgi:hypothetical protein